MSGEEVSSHSSDGFIPQHLGLTEFIVEKWKSYGHQVALIDPYSNRQLTYLELLENIDNYRTILHEEGLCKGDVICILCHNIIEYPIILYAASGLGGIVTPCNPLNTTDELCHQLFESSSKFIVTLPEYSSKVDAACAQTKIIQRKFIIGSSPGYVSLNNDPRERLPSDVNINAYDTALILYSSGTSGLPKGVMLSHYNLIANICQISHYEPKEIRKTDILICVVPLFHIFGIVLMMNLSLYSGAQVVILRKYKIEFFLQCIEKYKVSYSPIVPPIAVDLTKNSEVSRFDLRCIKQITCGAAPLSKEVHNELIRKIPSATICQGYGMSELGCATYMPKDKNKIGSVGKTIPMSRMKIVDINSGACVGPYNDGEVCIKGPQIMKGYLNDKQATLNTIDREGWLHTGDIGFLDADGYLFIIDRLKELIKYKGYQVAPAELEGILLKHPKIIDVAVVATPHLEYGELPTAYIVRQNEECCLTEKEVHQYLNDIVAPYKKLRGGVLFVDSIPKTASGKLLRRELKYTFSSKL